MLLLEEQSASGEQIRRPAWRVDPMAKDDEQLPNSAHRDQASTRSSSPLLPNPRPIASRFRYPSPSLECERTRDAGPLIGEKIAHKIGVCLYLEWISGNCRRSEACSPHSGPARSKGPTAGDAQGGKRFDRGGGRAQNGSGRVM